MSGQVFFAQKAFIVHEGKLLAIQKSDCCPYYPGHWEVPGGRMEYGESADEHIRREVREEVGIEIEPGELFHIWDWRIGGREPGPHVVAVARLARPLTLDVSIAHQEESDAIAQALWIPLGELTAYSWIPNMKPVIESFLKSHAHRNAA